MEGTKNVSSCDEVLPVIQIHKPITDSECSKNKQNNDMSIATGDSSLPFKMLHEKMDPSKVTTSPSTNLASEEQCTDVERVKHNK